MRVGRDVAVVAGTLLVNRYLQGRPLLDKQAQRVVNGGLGERWNFLNHIVVDFVHRRVCAMSQQVFHHCHTLHRRLNPVLGKIIKNFSVTHN